MTLSKKCPVCDGSGLWTRPVFDAKEEQCPNCSGTGRIDTNEPIRRGYICDTCRHAFETDFTMQPESLEDMTRTCPRCGNAGFLAIETMADLIRCHAIIMLIGSEE